MANLLIDKTLTSAYVFTGSFADITGMSQSVTVAGTGSVNILMTSLELDENVAGDVCVELRFTVDGSPVGPVLSAFLDAADELSGRTLMFAVDGLSSGSHTFAVQGRNRSGTGQVETAFQRAFQVVEIESDVSILVDLATSAANTAPASFANMTNLSQSKTPQTGSVLLFIAGAQVLGDNGNFATDYRFAIDGTRDGPRLMDASDDVDKTDGLAMAWAVDGVSAAAHTFSIQWQIAKGSPVMDTARQRTFQVIEFTDLADLLIDNESLASDTAPASYANMVGMSGSPDIDSANSIALVLANYVQDSSGGDDEVTESRLSIGAGGFEGAEMSQFKDGIDRSASTLLARAVDGESGVTAMSMQWQIGKLTPTADTGRERTFQVVDLKAGAITASGTPSIPAITASGTALVRKQANGTPSIPAITASGTAVVHRAASGAAILTAIVAAGAATVVHTASGSPTLTPVEAAGTAQVIRSASGAPSIPVIEAAGTAQVIRNASGAVSIPVIEAAGSATVTNTASGVAVLTPVQASGTVDLTRNANGAPSLPAIEASGAATVHRAASGAASLAPVEASGTATVINTASGSAELPAIEASGSVELVRNASGAPSIPAISATGTALVIRMASGAAILPSITASGTASSAVPSVVIDTDELIARTIEIELIARVHT